MKRIGVLGLCVGVALAVGAAGGAEAGKADDTLNVAVSGESATASYRSAMANAVANNLGQTVMTLTAIATVWWGTYAVRVGDL